MKTSHIISIFTVLAVLLASSISYADTSFKDRVTTFFETSNLDVGIGWANYIGTNNEGTSLRNTGPSIHARYGNDWGIGASYEEAERIDGGQHGHNIKFIDIGLDRKFAFVDDQLIITIGGGWSHPIVDEKEASREALAIMMNTYYFENLEGFPWWPGYRLKMDDAFYVALGAKVNLAKNVLIFDQIDLGVDLKYRVYRTSIEGRDGDRCHKWGGNTDGSKAELQLTLIF